MTRSEALRAAAECFARVKAHASSAISDRALAQATYMQALAKTGEGYVALAKELREGS